MSKYATVAASEDMNDPDWWAVSVNVVDGDAPVRIDHGDSQWYMPADVVEAVINEVLRIRMLEADQSKPLLPGTAIPAPPGGVGEWRLIAFRSSVDDDGWRYEWRPI